MRRIGGNRVDFRTMQYRISSPKGEEDQSIISMRIRDSEGNATIGLLSSTYPLTKRNKQYICNQLFWQSKNLMTRKKCSLETLPIRIQIGAYETDEIPSS